MNTPTPVFLHGYSGDGASLQEFASLCFPDRQPVCVDLPGFGTTSLTSQLAETDPREYLRETWRVVRQAVPEGKIHLVGHSYGAVLAFALAAEHADEVVQVDVFNPGVFPKFWPRMGLVPISLLRFVPGGLRAFTWALQRRALVDAVTRSMVYKGWSKESKQRVYAMRRKESFTYSPQMFLLSLHALRMPRVLDSVRCTVPVRIVQASDDTITTHQSAEWIKRRSDTASITVTFGGHLGVVAEPGRVAQLLYGTNPQPAGSGDGGETQSGAKS